MPVRYDQDTKAKAIRLVREHAGDYPSEYPAITAVARRLGMAPETLRKWIRQAAVDEGQAPGVSSEAAREIRELKRKVSELERMIEIAPLARRAAIFPAARSRGSVTTIWEPQSRYLGAPIQVPGGPNLGTGGFQSRYCFRIYRTTREDLPAAP
jgi:transposase